MKARPRRAENRIADELNLWFAKHDLSPIERKPVIGRKGPDFTYNELNLNLDAKSRKSNPKSYKITTSEITISWSGYHRVWGMRLRDLDFIISPQLNLTHHIKSSVVVNKWIKHMGINGGVILHWPGTPFKDAVLCLNLATILHIREVINASKS